MIGAFLNAGKGIADSIRLKEKKIELEDEIKRYEDPEYFLNDIDEIYPRTIAKNQILLAEYILERNKSFKTKDIRALWERVKGMMNQNIKDVEEQLKLQEANKLDIALLVSGLSQLSTQFDLELLTLKEEIETVSNYEEVKKSTLEKLSKMEETYKDEQNNLFNTFQQQLANNKEAFHNLIKLKEQILSNKINEIDSAMNSSVSDLKKKVTQIQQEYKAADNKINHFALRIQNEMINNVEKLNEDIQQQKQYMYKIETKFEQLIQTSEQDQKVRIAKQQKLTLSLAIPLYIICLVFGVLIYLQ